MVALNLSPHSTNYLTSQLINQQLTNNKMDFTLSSNVAAVPNFPVKFIADGTGRISMEGAVRITGTPAAGMTLGFLPKRLKSTRDWFCNLVVLRGASTYLQNVLKVDNRHA